MHPIDVARPLVRCRCERPIVAHVIGGQFVSCRELAEREADLDERIVVPPDARD